MKTLFCLIGAVCLLATGSISTVVLSHDSFKTDYKIDLLRDGYIVKDNQGKIHRIKNGDLETWFLNDNL